MTNNIQHKMGVGYNTRERQPNDYYSTDPKAIDYLLQHESLNKNVWECACGSGNLSKRLVQYGHNVYSTDIVYRGYGERE